jgi:hypothetical protein
MLWMLALSLAAQTTPRLDYVGLSVAVLRGDRVLLARGAGETERTVVTVYYTGDWQAYFDYESY